MTMAVTWTRRLAHFLLGRAVKVMPAALSDWAGAMQNELTYVADDREALRWASGCVWFAHWAHLRQLRLLDVPAVRTTGVLLAAFCGFQMIFATVMTLAYRLNAMRITDLLGRLTPGGDFRRIVPLMETLPAWLHALSVSAGACYVIAAFCIIGRRRFAHVPLLLAVTLTLGIRVIERPLIDAVGTVVVAKPSVLAAVLIPIVLPFLLAMVAWSESRQKSTHNLGCTP